MAAIEPVYIEPSSEGCVRGTDEVSGPVSTSPSSVLRCTVGIQPRSPGGSWLRRSRCLRRLRQCVALGLGKHLRLGLPYPHRVQWLQSSRYTSSRLQKAELGVPMRYPVQFPPARLLFYVVPLESSHAPPVVLGCAGNELFQNQLPAPTSYSRVYRHVPNRGLFVGHYATVHGTSPLQPEPAADFLPASR